MKILELESKDEGYYRPGAYCKKCNILYTKKPLPKTELLFEIMIRSIRPIKKQLLINHDLFHLRELQEQHKKTPLWELQMEVDLLKQTTPIIRR